jgi:hypothetical protein
MLRGENHQTLTPVKTPDFERIIRRFVDEKVAIDPRRNQEDRLIDQVVLIPFKSSPDEVLELVLRSGDLKNL